MSYYFNHILCDPWLKFSKVVITDKVELFYIQIGNFNIVVISD